MKESITKLLMGTGGVAATEIVQQASMINPETITTTTNLIIQIVIGIVTLFGIFKKKPKV